MNQVLFAVLAVVIAGGALLTVTLRNLLHAAIAFIACHLGVACLMLALDHELLALMQVLVYIGGVTIFVVYTVLLTTHLGEKHQNARWPTLVAGGLLAVAAAVVIGGAAWTGAWSASPVPGTRLDELGRRLLDPAAGGMLIPFEVISVLLLAALVGAATIAVRGRDHVGGTPAPPPDIDASTDRPRGEAAP